MINYRIDAIEVLLNEDCILKRYYPLIPFKNKIIKRFTEENILTKDDVIVEDEILYDIFNNAELVNLFKRFLNMYEVNNSKLKEIEKLELTDEERESFSELYLLPGVKETRARLYYLSGFKSLKDIASKMPEEIIATTKKVIVGNNLDYKEPLYKEANTHIAVAKLLTIYIYI